MPLQSPPDDERYIVLIEFIPIVIAIVTVPFLEYDGAVWSVV